jgi:hypothetical protein
MALQAESFFVLGELSLRREFGKKLAGGNEIGGRNRRIIWLSSLTGSTGALR